MGKHYVQVSASGLLLGEIDPNKCNHYSRFDIVQEVPRVTHSDEGIPLYFVEIGVVRRREDEDIRKDELALITHRQAMAGGTQENRLTQLEQENHRLKAQNEALLETIDFHEELLVELAEVVYA